MNNKEFLKEYLNGYSPVAQETEGQNIWINYVKDFADEVKLDSYGTAYTILRGQQGPTPNKKVVLEAHCDEIAWIVTYIEKDGFLRVKTHGGSDNMIAPSKSVMVPEVVPFARIVAPIIGSPFESATVPEMVFCWANIRLLNNKNALRNSTLNLHFTFMLLLN